MEHTIETDHKSILGMIIYALDSTLNIKDAQFV